MPLLNSSTGPSGPSAALLHPASRRRVLKHFTPDTTLVADVLDKLTDAYSISLSLPLFCPFLSLPSSSWTVKTGKTVAISRRTSYYQCGKDD